MLEQPGGHLKFKTWLLGGVSTSALWQKTLSSGGRLDVSAAYQLAVRTLNAAKQAEKQVVVYPNPALSDSPVWVQIRGGRSDRLQVTWFTSGGERIFSEVYELPEPVSEIYTRPLYLPSGTYTVRLVDLTGGFDPIAARITIFD